MKIKEIYGCIWMYTVCTIVYDEFDDCVLIIDDCVLNIDDCVLITD